MLPTHPPLEMLHKDNALPHQVSTAEPRESRWCCAGSQGQRDPSHSPVALGHTQPPRAAQQLAGSSPSSCQAVLPQLGPGWKAAVCPQGPGGSELVGSRTGRGTARLTACPPLPHTPGTRSHCPALLSQLHKEQTLLVLLTRPSLTSTRATFGAL